MRGKNALREEEVVGRLKPITSWGLSSDQNGVCFRNIEADIQKYNDLIGKESIGEILRKGNDFLQRQFGLLITQEIFLEKSPAKGIFLLAKSKCSCGNTLVSPLNLLVSGRLTDCGCRTPLPAKDAAAITVYPSETPTCWTTTVDGIQWLGPRYRWFVTFFDRNVCVLRKYTADTKEALKLRRDAERKYYGQSVIDQYSELMYLELEQMRRSYIASHPPKIEGVYWDKSVHRWNVRFWHKGRGEFVVNKFFKNRDDAITERFRIEKLYYGTTLIPERYLSLL
ncbi:hypothetical protein [Anaerotruncus colihominis]|uniref:Uncharacterized protein n=1 Tax=Anaerotruncus colihominis TaxID=169435 RepID=A0A845SZU2_9FIRM|nr:hypothetical protein [Anaerotruncus colihominis]NDO37781.1 hypothetical protein [Anaerotruncus colihominis]